MSRSDKAAAVAELADQFRTAVGAVLTEYRGLTVKQLQELRQSLGDDTSYAVVKNTLTKIAAKEAGVDAFDDLLTGPSAIAFISGDPVLAARGLRDFASNNTPLVIKGGVLDGKVLSPEEIAKIADLESREVLLAKLAGAMRASLQQVVNLFQAPLSQFARLAEALKAQTEPEDAEPEVAADDLDAPAVPEVEAPASAATDVDAPAVDQPDAEAPVAGSPDTDESATPT